MNPDSIVITGLGLVTSLGLTAEETWQGVLAGRSSIGPMPALETSAPDGKGGYQAPDLPVDFAADSQREIRYLKWTLAAALENAAVLEKFPYDPRRCGYVLGTTLHGMRAGGQFLRSNDYAHLSSFLAGSVLQQVTAHLPLRGDLITTCSACSSSLGSIALAATLLETRQLDLVVAGGYDTVSEYAYGGFNSLRLVADGPLRSFTRGRQGMKLGEGYGIVVLERAGDAAARGGKPLAVVAGWGESADAHHLTQPHPKGEGAAAAITAAIRRANVSVSEIDLIAAHATGTPDNDAGEHAALAAVFGEHLPQIPVVAFKTHIGHTLGGAGAVELILSAMALRDQIVPACANVTADDIEFPDLAVSTGSPRSAALRTTLNTSLGFGGANTCIILSGVPVSGVPASAGTVSIDSDTQISDRPTHREVCITGIGIVLPGMVGVDAFTAHMQQPAGILDRDTGPIPEQQFIHLLNARRVRRMSEYVKLTLAATTLACRDAGFTDESPLPCDTSVLLGSTHGSSSYCVDYYRNIVTGGFVAANPLLFAEGVPNAAAAHLSLNLSLKGACQTVIGSRTAGLDALRLASLRISSGQWDRAVVGAAEEYLPLINEGYRHCGLYSPDGIGGFVTGAGAVTLILESRESVERRVGRSRGAVTGSASSRWVDGDIMDAIRSVLASIGRVSEVIGSGNNTWIDRAESAAVQRTRPQATMNRLYGHLPELFSVGPLAAVAASLTDASAAECGILCTGYDGVVSAVAVSRDPAPHVMP